MTVIVIIMFTLELSNKIQLTPNRSFTQQDEEYYGYPSPPKDDFIEKQKKIAKNTSLGFLFGGPIGAIIGAGQANHEHVLKEKEKEKSSSYHEIHGNDRIF